MIDSNILIWSAKQFEDSIIFQVYITLTFQVKLMQSYQHTKNLSRIFLECKCWTK